MSKEEIVEILNPHLHEHIGLAMREDIASEISKKSESEKLSFAIEFLRELGCAWKALNPDAYIDSVRMIRELEKNL